LQYFAYQGASRRSDLDHSDIARLFVTAALAAEPNLVLELNEGIRSLSARQQVTFVDVHRAFGGDLSLIGPDGLHPTAAGYQRIADTVFQALKSAFERQ